MTGAFWPLVRHDLVFNTERNSEWSQGWLRSYAVISWVGIFALLTWQGPAIHFNLNLVWVVTLAILVLAVGFPTGHIMHEQKNATLEWWLSLPLPRWQLIVSKFFASIILTMRRALSIIGLVALAGIYISLLNGSFSTVFLKEYLITGAEWTITMALFIPLLSALGVFFGTVGLSFIRALRPAFWAILVLIGWMLSGLLHPYVVWPPYGGVLGLMPASGFLAAMLLSWIAAYVVLRLSGYILNRHVEL